ncbi:MAG: hypothetical protein IJU40_03840 [Desulfovibrionaceae bacterium]|nr:hypothetical protein [Desulfovibrionaceae bacterium]
MHPQLLHIKLIFLEGTRTSVPKSLKPIVFGTPAIPEQKWPSSKQILP